MRQKLATLASLILVALLPIIAKAQEYPELMAKTACTGCVMPGGKSQRYEIITKTSVQKTPTGWIYKLTMTNNSRVDLRFLLTIRKGKTIYYVSRAFNDKNRQPGNPAGNGALLVSVPKWKTITLSVFDTYPPIEMTNAFALTIDKQDRGFTEHVFSLYMPQWPYLEDVLK